VLVRESRVASEARAFEPYRGKERRGSAESRPESVRTRARPPAGTRFWKRETATVRSLARFLRRDRSESTARLRGRRFGPLRKNERDVDCSDVPLVTTSRRLLKWPRAPAVSGDFRLRTRIARYFRYWPPRFLQNPGFTYIPDCTHTPIRLSEQLSPASRLRQKAHFPRARRLGHRSGEKALPCSVSTPQRRRRGWTIEMAASQPGNDVDTLLFGA
jgi:hypothetical protein